MAKAGSPETIQDIEEIVLRWAMESFEYAKTREQAKISKDLLQYNINWKNVKFLFDSPSYDILPFLGGSSGAKQNVQPQCLFRTYFANNTKQEQEYSFKTERTTRSTATVIIENGFTRGMDFSMKLATPCEVLEANAGFKREISVCNIGEDTVEEELMWGVDSNVRVPPHTETTAELIITEAQCSGNFLMHTRFHGRVIVSVTNLKENNSLVTVLEGNIADIMSREIQRGLKGFKLDKRVVIAETRGKCNFKFKTSPGKRNFQFKTCSP
ncbi:MAG: ETX/MTX2 family pore-forming toxin [Gammaproteobacteria bacterium]|nr:ETX/MTX2 family pore-forming toxin [Gammaproteobacteria bacterium]